MVSHEVLAGPAESPVGWRTGSDEAGKLWCLLAEGSAHSSCDHPQGCIATYIMAASFPRMSDRGEQKAQVSCSALLTEQSYTSGGNCTSCKLQVRATVLQIAPRSKSQAYH